MRDGWRETTLGEVATQHIDGFSVLPDETYTNLGVQWYAGGTFARDPKRGSDMKATRLFRVKPGQFIYNRMFVTEGSFALVSGEHADGVVSNEFPAFDLDEAQILPEYLLAYFQQPEVWRAVADEASGTTKSRRRWKESQFLARTIALPPLDEQRRIVDLIAAVDDAVDAAEAEADGAAALLSATLDASSRDKTASLSALASIMSGASWGKGDVRTVAGDGVTPVLTIANTKPDGSISGEPTLVHGLSAKSVRLNEHSLIAIRTNGNHDRIGNVYRVPEEHVGAAVSAFQFVVDPIDPADSAYLHWMMRAPSFQAAVTSEASGSTGLGNIAATKLREMQVPWPSAPETRAAQASTFASIEACSLSARATADALRTLRSNLLTVLLSGEHEIPSSYDALLGEVA